MAELPPPEWCLRMTLPELYRALALDMRIRADIRL